MTSKPSFGPRTTGIQVVSAFPGQIRGKTILITGVSPNGLGAQVALEIASQAPSLLILTGRTESKVQSVIDDIRTTYPSARLRFLKLDISSLDSVRAAVAEINTYPEEKVDVLINNSGVMNIPERTLSTDGIEMHLTTNYLGPFFFTALLAPKLLAAVPSRVVNVSSNGYALSPFRFSDYNFSAPKGSLPPDEEPIRDTCSTFGIPCDTGYIPAIAYGQSKTAAILHTMALNAKLGGKGSELYRCTQEPSGRSCGGRWIPLRPNKFSRRYR